MNFAAGKLKPLIFAIVAMTAGSAASAQIVNTGGTERNFTAYNHATGAPVQLTDFAGKVVVLDYFAYWCGWCALDCPQTETDIQQYYAALGGNPSGIPVQVVSISIDQTDPAATTSFISNAGIALALDDTLGEAYAENNYTDQIPTYVVINGVADATGMTQWQVVYTSVGYPGAVALRQAIDSVVVQQASSLPSVTTQPVSQTIAPGGSVEFTVVASGGVSFQWQLNGVDLTDTNGVSGSGEPQLLVQGVNSSMAGSYTCVVTNSLGSVTSQPAVLQIGSGSPPGQLSSISARAFVGSGDDILIGGFYINGGTSATVLVQGIGPGLATPPFNVTGVLQHPSLSIHQTQNGKDVVLYSNSGWGSSPVLLAAAAAVYAQPVLQLGSSDAELLVTLPPGGYTAEVAGADGGSGVALCAIYQLP